MTRRPLLVVALALLISGGAVAADDDAAEALDADLLARLRHPLLELRSEAEAEVALREDAETVLESLRQAGHGSLRSAAWRVYLRRPDLLDPACALEALDDADPRVGAVAADALVAAATVSGPPAGPWVAEGTLLGRAQRVLTPALTAALERAPAEQVPVAAFRLGAGIVPCLASIATDRGVHNRVRSVAASLLARIDGPEARIALAELTRRGSFSDRSQIFGHLADLSLSPDERERVYDSVREPGDDAERLSWRTLLRHGMHWRERGPFLRFVAAHPPTDESDREALRRWLSSMLQRRSPPSHMRTEAAAMLALGEPSDAEIRTIVRACKLPGRPRWRGRAEELGSVLVLLEPYADRESFRDALHGLLEEFEFDASEADIVLVDLPRSVEAWGRYLLGTEEPARLEEMATALILGAGEEPPWAARRLGAELWRRLGEPRVELIRALVDDGDPVLRRHALRWCGSLPAAEAAAAVVSGLVDADLGVLLLAAEIVVPTYSAETVERLLDTAVSGSRGQRRLAWRLVVAAVEACPEPPADFLASRPDGNTALDDRIRAAHVVRQHLVR